MNFRRSTYIALVVATALCTPVAADDLILEAPDGTEVTIHRDDYGVPHIYGDSEIGVFFGQGFAVAQDRLAQLDQFRMAAEGRLAQLLGADYVEADKQTHLLSYTEAERHEQFRALPQEIQAIFEAYRDGVNAYLDLVRADPDRLAPQELFFFAALGQEITPWTVNNSIAIVQMLNRRFGQFGGYELDRLVELQENGQAWFDTYRPINDPRVPTTIQAPVATKPVIPTVRTYMGPSVQASVVQDLTEKRARVINQMKTLGIPTKFGSFAVLISGSKSASGNAMLLGAPQMGPPAENEVSIVNEVELMCPALHVSGMTVAGIPGVTIGRNEHFAWTITSGMSDNTDTFIETTRDSSFSQYWYNGEWRDFEVIHSTVYQHAEPITFTHYRTVHGPVFGQDLDQQQVYAMNMAFWGKEIGFFETAYQIAKSATPDQAATYLKDAPMSFNFFIAGKDQTIRYRHVGKYPDRSDGVDPRLPRSGDGSEDWMGFIAPEDLPSSVNPAQGYFVNWNNKPAPGWNNGDNIPWAFDSELVVPKVVTNRVSAIETYVGSIPAMTFENLKDVPKQIQSYGTYQQVFELSESNIRGKSIIAPGQSGFVSISGQRDIHFADQWPLHLAWEFKDMIFGRFTPGDFNEDEVVDLKDFLLFAQQFGRKQGNAEFDAAYDLNGNGAVDFQDFLLFAQRFTQPEAGGKQGVPKRAPKKTLIQGHVKLASEAQPSTNQMQVVVRVQDARPAAGYAMRITYNEKALAFVSANESAASTQSVKTQPVILQMTQTPGEAVLADVLSDNDEKSDHTLTRLTFRVLDSTAPRRVAVTEAFVTDGSGQISAVHGAHLSDAVASKATFALMQNAPNPFNPNTQIAYQIPEDGDVSLVIYNALGQQIRTLIQDPQEVGYHQVSWDGKDAFGRQVSSGVYFYRLAASGRQQIRRMTLLK